MIGVILLTYNRLTYALQTLDALYAHLITRMPVLLHIADDGSPQDYRTELYQFARQRWDNVTVSNSQRGGYGASYNLATQVLHQQCDLLLPLEDDWTLTRDLDLDPLVRVLRAGGSIESIRLGYLGFTQQMKGELLHQEGQTFLLLDPDSPEPHVFAGHPRLETRGYQRGIGPWPEGVPAGETEFHVAHRPEARRGVAWPLDLVHPRGDLFAHIGTVPAGLPDPVESVA